MSVPDSLLDEDDRMCVLCEAWITSRERLCQGCQADAINRLMEWAEESRREAR